MKTVSGSPDPKHVSTSYVERQNLTMRMSIRRFTRLTNGFPKKVESHGHAVALYFAYYNFCRTPINPRDASDGSRADRSRLERGGVDCAVAGTCSEEARLV